MKKSIHSLEYQLVLEKLVAMRRLAGLTQRDLAKKLEREHSFVWRIETGERRLDVVEFFWVCQALNQDAPTVYKSLIHSFINAYAFDSRIRFVADKRGSYTVKKKTKT